MIQVKIKRRNRRFDIEAMLVVFRQLQSQFALDITNESVSPTPEFLRGAADDLSKRLAIKVSPTEAYCLWRLVFDHLDRLRVKNSELSDLAFWYKINPFTLTESQRLGLASNLPRVKAQDTLHNGHYDGADYRTVFALVLLATGDLKKAEAAQAASLERYVDQSIARNTRR